jgi:hypothetical protein
MKNKKSVIIGIAVLAVLGFLGYPHLRWFNYTMIVREEIGVKQLGRFPDIQKLLDVEGILKAKGKTSGFEGVKVKLVLDDRDMGDAHFWYFVVHVDSGSHTFTGERHIETSFDRPDLEELQDNEVTITHTKRR